MQHVNKTQAQGHVLTVTAFAVVLPPCMVSARSINVSWRMWLVSSSITKCESRMQATISEGLVGDHVIAQMSHSSAYSKCVSKVQQHAKALCMLFRTHNMLPAVYKKFNWQQNIKLHNATCQNLAALYQLQCSREACRLHTFTFGL